MTRFRLVLALLLLLPAAGPGCSRTDVFAARRGAPAVAVEPARVRLAPGASVRFSAKTVPDAAPVDWSIFPADLGRIDADGLYTAPATLPSAPLEVQVRAALRDRPDVFGEAKALLGAEGPAALRKVSGDGQQATVGEPLPEPLVVRVEDADGTPLAGVPVKFGSPGASEDAERVSDEQGLASAAPVAGTVAGPQVFPVYTTGLPAVEFMAGAQPGPLAKLTASHPRPRGRPGVPLDEPAEIRFHDRFGNGIAGRAATARPPDGAVATAKDEKSGDDGLQRWSLVLGPAAGRQEFVFASEDGAHEASLAIHAVTTVPARLEIVSGDWQSGVVDTELAQPLVVRLVDENGQPAPGAPVAWKAEGAALAAADEATDGEGLARARVRLGTLAGFARVTVDGGPVRDSPATFVARALAGAPTQLAYVSGANQTATAGTRFGAAFGVRATDAHGNGVPRLAVHFEAVEGGGSVDPADVMTGTDGLAQTTLVAGAAGQQKYRASPRGFDARVVEITTTAIVPTGLQLERVSGDGQSGPVDTVLPQPLVVRVLSAGTPVPGVPVSFATATGNGQVSPAIATSAADGRASASATLGRTPGLQRFSATLPGAASGPVYFEATALSPGVAVFRAVSGGGQTGPAWQHLPQPLVVEALDANGQGVPGIGVSFAPPAGGAVTTPNTVTGADGRASSQAILAGPGEQIFTAMTAGLPAVFFRETAIDPNARRHLRIVSGQGQRATVNTALAQPLVVEVVNDAGAPVANVEVRWRADAAGAAVTPASARTDAQGRAQAAAKLGGAVGTQKFHAESTDAVGSPADFQAEATPAPAVRLVAVRGDGQSGNAGQPLAQPLVARVLDAQGNGVAGTAVRCSAGVGGGLVAPATATSNAAGEVSFQATLGASAGAQTFVAEAPGLQGSPLVFTATATRPVKQVLVSPPSARVGVGGSVRYSALAVYLDGTTGPVTEQATWTSSAPAVAAVHDAAGSKGVAQALAAGTATVRATLQGATGEATLRVDAATLRSIVIHPAAAAVAQGSSRQFRAEGVYTDNTVADVTDSATWSSSNPAVASVRDTPGSRGLVQGLTAGTSTLTAAVAGVSGTRLVTVTAAALAALEVTPQNVIQPAGTRLQLRAIATLADGTVQDVTPSALWSSSDTTLLTVQNAPAAAGLATLQAAGAPRVRAAWGGVTGESAVTITGATVTSLSVRPGRLDLVVQDVFQLRAVATWSDGSASDATQLATWTTTAPQVATVSNAPAQQGFVSAVGAGTATVTAQLGSATGTTSVRVADRQLLGLQILGPDTCAKGTVLRLRAGALYGNGMPADISDQAAWSSSDPRIAVVGQGANGGLVQCLAEGRVSVTATFRGQTSTRDLRVTAAVVTGIAVTPASAQLARGDRRAFFANATWSDGQQRDVTALVTWTSSNNAVATVSNAPLTRGEVAGVTPGTVQISATLGGVAGRATVTVSAAQLTHIVINPANPAVRMRQRVVEFNAIALYDDNTTQDVTDFAVWSTSDPDVATISNDERFSGLVVLQGTGSCIVGATYAGRMGSTTLSVRQ